MSLYGQATRTILDQIVSRKRDQLDRLYRQTSLADMRRLALQGQIAGESTAASFHAALCQNGRLALIGEIKRASPSKGVIQPDFQPERTALAYEQAGLAAISVITETDFFLGSDQILSQVRQAVLLPLLRKDFIIDPIQIYQARLLGASAVLLIAALYDTAGLAELLDVCREADLAALVEVHDLDELMRALSVGASLIGINNRDLHTFQVDIATTERLAGLVPSDRLVVAESGLSSARDVARVYRAGARAALIGEVLMRETTADGLSARVHELLREIPQ